MMQKVFDNNKIKSFIEENHKDEVRFENIVFDDKEAFMFDSVKPCYVFNNCYFKSHRFDFVVKKIRRQKEYLAIVFKNCVFESDVFISGCELENLEITDCEFHSKRFVVAESKIKRVGIINNPNCAKTIDNIHFHSENEIDYLDMRLLSVTGAFNIDESNIKEFYAAKNSFKHIYFKKLKVEEKLTFWDNSIEKNSTISNSSIGKSLFRDSKFYNVLNFFETNFLQITSFECIKTTENSTVKISNCSFENKVFFDNSFLGILKLDTSFFSDIVSFQNFQCNTIELNRVHFDKVAFFNDINIKLLRSLDVKTISIIKNQLNKTDNNIDYVKMNALEKRKFFQSLSRKNTDFFVLWLNKISNNFGTSWLKGIWFTLKCSAIFFVMLLAVNNFVKSSYPLSINIKHDWAKFDFILAEFLKFIFSFGFTSPEFQSSGWLFLIFIVAKIFIGFGIYQTIAAFRKFK